MINVGDRAARSGDGDAAFPCDMPRVVEPVDAHALRVYIEIDQETHERGRNRFEPRRGCRFRRRTADQQSARTLGRLQRGDQAHGSGADDRAIKLARHHGGSTQPKRGSSLIQSNDTSSPSLLTASAKSSMPPPDTMDPRA